MTSSASPSAPLAVLYIGGPSIDRVTIDRMAPSLGVSLSCVEGLPAALSALDGKRFAFCLLDLSGDGVSNRVVRAIGTQHPEMLMVGLVDSARPEEISEAIRGGAFDVLNRPVNPRDLAAVIGNVKERLSLGKADSPTAIPEMASYGLFGRSAAMRQVMDLVLRAAPSRCGILVSGERGTGREMVARALHVHGLNAQAAFVKVDCATATPQDLEHELFGLLSERRSNGSERGRVIKRIVRSSQVYQANGGTLFLENLLEMPLRVQGELVRLLRDREAIVNGERQPVDLDIRPIGACEPGFELALDDGRLRSDLYERLSVIRIDLPPLRQRRDDISLLATYFLKGACHASGVPAKTLTRSALTLLAALPWRGNARELRALIERLVVVIPQGLIRLEDVLAHVRLDGGSGPAGATLREAKRRFEREYITAVLRQHHGRMGEAAEALGIQRTNLYRKVRQLNVARSPGGRNEA